MAHTEGRTERRAKRRTIPYIFGNDRLDELLWQLLDDADPALRAYVYRIHNGQKIKPALFVGYPFRDLLDRLRDEHGGGTFHILIRRGKRMELSGIIGIEAPRAWRSPR